MPLYSSVQKSAKVPPIASPAFCVPAPDKLYLDVIKPPPAAQDVPSYSSVHVLSPKLLPPIASPAFCVPAPAKRYLPVDNAPPTDQESTLPNPQYETIGILLVVSNQ